MTLQMCFNRQVAVNYHARVFTDWKRVHQVVTIVLTSDPCSCQIPKTLSCIRAVPDRVQNNSSTAACVPMSTTALVNNSHRTSSPIADMKRQWETGRAYLYTKSRVDGRWSFGKLPATSVSDTVMTSWHAIAISWEHKGIDDKKRGGTWCDIDSVLMSSWRQCHDEWWSSLDGAVLASPRVLNCLIVYNINWHIFMDNIGGFDYWCNLLLWDPAAQMTSLKSSVMIMSKYANNYL